MARDGAGTYTRTHADYVYGEVIDQAAVNAELNDIATALTESLTGKFWWGGTAGGTADARTITPSPSIAAYAAGQKWAFINGAAANATATPTLTISGLAPRTVKRADGSALLPGDWPANALIEVIDDGTNLRLVERINGAFSGSFTGSIIQAEGAAVASATSTNIWANDGDTVHITGTTTITSFGTAVQAGQWKRVIFDGALTLTHGANLSLPGSANITTAADDMAFVYADTTTQFDVIYFKKNGRAPVTSGEVLLSTVTASSSATVQLTYGGVDLYDKFIVVATGVVAATDTATLMCEIYQDSAFVTSGYYAHLASPTSGAATYSGAAQSNTANIQVTTALDNTSESGADITMNIAVKPAGSQKGLHWTGRHFDNTAKVETLLIGAASNDLNGVIQGIKFYMSSGNITSGIFNLYGVVRT